jgi:hypothetical protein
MSLDISKIHCWCICLSQILCSHFSLVLCSMTPAEITAPDNDLSAGMEWLVGLNLRKFFRNRAKRAGAPRFLKSGYPSVNSM